MGLMETVLDLERHGHLVYVREPVDPYLEMAEIQRRAYRAGAPALFFVNVKGTDFPCVSNLFGTMARCYYLFRHSFEAVRQAVRIKADPADFAAGLLRGGWRRPGAYVGLPLVALHALPRHISARRAPVMAGETQIAALPAITSWPMDGGPFITLPQVLSLDPMGSGIRGANLGMYRVQLAGNDYQANAEVGLHYQIHRGMGIHHQAALASGQPLKVSIFVGGPPAHTFAAVLPLPEGLSELMFAGMLAGRRFRYSRWQGHTLSADADFCIVGTVTGATKPEGPFGDHLGYYSLRHPFPVMRVERVFHRRDAVWPFTVVGRPPQEDSCFGQLIHELTAPMVPVSLPGVRALHAVDEAGVHPLLLAVGSERYVPYDRRRPQELLTQANAILGFNQCSLAKYLLIVDGADAPDLKVGDVPGFLTHLLERFDPERDLHFQTRTTIDTLDYSGTGLNEGSKLVIAACGPARRVLGRALPDGQLPDGFGEPRLALPGIVVLRGPRFVDHARAARELQALAASLAERELSAWPLWVICDDSEFSARTLGNFLWVCFTRTNPSHDCHGVGATTSFKHWGCRGPLLWDARLKPHHAPPLVEDEAVSRRVDELCRPGRSLYGLLD